LAAATTAPLFPLVTRRIKTLHAIHPNPGIREWYRQRIVDMINEAHVELTALLAPAWPTSPATAHATPELQLTHDAGINDVRAKLKAWGVRWVKNFDKLAPQIAAQFASKNFAVTEHTLKNALRDAGFTVRFAPTTASMNAYKAVVAENVGLIRSIPQQYLTNVQSLVWQSVQRGSDMATLSVKLREQYGVTERRAALIARDQNAKAKATIENTRRQQIGIKQAIWQHSSAGKVPRPEHVGFNGKVFDLAKGMYDSVEKEWILPGQLINCRCTSRAIIPGIEEIG
jgi:SPP1 gp7 family putative phage head morphogenesis protein